MRNGNRDGRVCRTERTFYLTIWKLCRPRAPELDSLLNPYSSALPIAWLSPQLIVYLERNTRLLVTQPRTVVEVIRYFGRSCKGLDVCCSGKRQDAEFRLSCLVPGQASDRLRTRELSLRVRGCSDSGTGVPLWGREIPKYAIGAYWRLENPSHKSSSHCTAEMCGN